MSDRTVAKSRTVKVVTTTGSSLRSDKEINKVQDQDAVQIYQNYMCAISLTKGSKERRSENLVMQLHKRRKGRRFIMWETRKRPIYRS